MPHLAVMRCGWQNEHLAAFILSKIAFVACPAKIGDDVGTDFFCTFFEVLHQEGNDYLAPRNSFAIQIKSGDTAKDFMKIEATKQIEYLIRLELPFFVGILNQEHSTLKIYSGEYLPILFSYRGLALHPEKTKIVYCKSSYHKGEYPEISFDFLGYTFRPRVARSRLGKMMVSFTPAISRKSARRIRKTMGNWQLRRWQFLDIAGVAGKTRACIQGWINYYGRFGKSELKRILYHLDEHIVTWIQGKYKKLRRRSKAFRWLRWVRKDNPCLFAHWRFRIEGGWTIGAV